MTQKRWLRVQGRGSASTLLSTCRNYDAEIIWKDGAVSRMKGELAMSEAALATLLDKGAAAELKSEALAQDLLKLEMSLGAMAQRQRKGQEDALASGDAITEAKTHFLEPKANFMAQVAEQTMVLQDCHAKLGSAQSDVARNKRASERPQ